MRAKVQPVLISPWQRRLNAFAYIIASITHLPRPLSTYYAPFNVASYAIKNAMPRSTYVIYVGLARKKERGEFALPQEDPSSFSLILRNIIYIITTDIDFTYVRYCVIPT